MCRGRLVVRWLNDLIVTRVIKARKWAHSLLIPYQMILEGLPMSICSLFRFRENLVFDQNQGMGYLWYNFQQSYFITI